MPKTRKSAATKCAEAKRSLRRIEPGLRSAASFMFRGRKAKAIDKLKSVLQTAADINREIHLKILSEFVRKGMFFQAKLEGMEKIEPVSSKLSKAFDPIFDLAKRAVREAQRETCA